MTVIQISPAYKPAYIYGGPTLSVALLCEALDSCGIALQVFTTTANGLQELEVPKGPVKVDGVSVFYFRRTLGGQIHLSVELLIKLLLATEKTDIFHVHSWWNATAILGALIGKLRGNKVIISPRGMLTSYSFNNRHFNLKKVFHRILGSWILSSCSFHVTSEKEKCNVLSLIKCAEITIIPNLVALIKPTKHSFRRFVANKPSFRLLFFSRIEQKKGIELMFDALQELKLTWTLTIAGAGKLEYIKSLKALSYKLNIQENINWVGFVQSENKQKIMEQHDLLVLFSYNENFANVVTESLSTGLPVAISEEVGLSDFIIEHNLGWVCKLDKLSIVNHLNNAAFDVKKRQRIHLTAPILVSKHFSTEVILKQYLELYELHEY